jgi:hypothetical protein
MTAGSRAVLNLIVSLIGAICYFLVGWLWSASAWRHSFDLGWLVVALILARYAATRIENGTLNAREYIAICSTALPGFVLELLANWGLHDFRLHDGLGALVRFAVFSCGLLVFVVALTALLRFSVGLDVLSRKDEATWHSTISVGASVIAASLVMGTALILYKGPDELGSRAGLLQSWFYWASLIVYFLLTLKMMLPLILRRARIVIEDFNQPDMRF